jgi:hypothetical protein
MNRYFAYGLEIESEVALPGVLPGSKPNADVTIRLGSVPDALPDPVRKAGYWQATRDAFLFRIRDVAKYLIVKGQHITIDRVPGGHQDVLKTYLMGSAFGALMHQRRLLVMHASSIQTAQGAVLFVGPSGLGKSTLLAALVDRGYAMLSDDVTAIDVQTQAAPVAFASFPTMRLGTDSAAHLALHVDSLPRVRYTEKHVVPVKRFCADPLPVRAVYALGIHEALNVQIEPVDPIQRFAIVGNNTYRYKFLESLGLHQVHFDAAARLARAVQIFRIQRPASTFLLEKLVDRLWAELGEPVNRSREQEVG